VVVVDALPWRGFWFAGASCVGEAGELTSMQAESGNGPRFWGRVCCEQPVPLSHLCGVCRRAAGGNKKNIRHPSHRSWGLAGRQRPPANPARGPSLQSRPSFLTHPTLPSTPR
jgi:hypothetical protein